MITLTNLRCWLFVLSFLFFSAVVNATDIPIIDAHSQADQNIVLKEIIELMDQAGVMHTILSLRGRRQPQDLIDFAAHYPDRITPAVRTKGQDIWQVKEQARKHRYGAMAEVLMWHREKPKHIVTTKTGEKRFPPKVVMPPDHPKALKLLAIARKNNWPFIPHIEFGSSGADYPVFMDKLEALMRTNPEHPFILIRMGMLEFKEVKRLIENHPNVHFIPAHSDPFSVKKSDSPFTKMFDGKRFASEWKNLIIHHVNRFILGFDMVWSHQWRRHYIKEVGLWRRALSELPPNIVHSVTHKNAERLWRLPPFG